MAKVEGLQGSIIQIVFVEFNDKQKEDYASILLRLVKPVSLWIFNKDVITRGYINEGDCPSWVNKSQFEVIKSRFKLWSAF